MSEREQCEDCVGTGIEWDQVGPSQCQGCGGRGHFDAEPKVRADIAADLLAVARAYEAWEADVILNADWSGDTPRLTQAQWDELVRVQGLRNAAIAKAEATP